MEDVRGRDREARKQLDNVIAPKCSKFEAQIHTGGRLRLREEGSGGMKVDDDAIKHFSEALCRNSVA